MFRFSRRAAQASSAPVECPCVSNFQRYKTRIGAGVGLFTVGVWLLGSSYARRSYDIEQHRNKRIVGIEETINKQTGTIKKLQEDLKVAQAAVLGHEATLRKLSDALVALEKYFDSRCQELTSAVESTGKSVVDTNRMTEAELKAHRSRLAELHASRAETEARLRVFETQVMQCREPLAKSEPQLVHDHAEPSKSATNCAAEAESSCGKKSCPVPEVASSTEESDHS